MPSIWPERGIRYLDSYLTNIVDQCIPYLDHQVARVLDTSIANDIPIAVRIHLLTASLFPEEGVAMPYHRMYGLTGIISRDCDWGSLMT